MYDRLRIKKLRSEKKVQEKIIDATSNKQQASANTTININININNDSNNIIITKLIHRFNLDLSTTQFTNPIQSNNNNQ